MAMTATQVREGFTTVTPYIITDQVEQLVTFAKAAFGAVETLKSPGGGGGFHYEMRIGDSMLMCGGGGAYEGPNKPMALHLYMPDVDSVYRRALAAGAESLYEPVNQPFGERQAGVKDRAGNMWVVARLLPGMKRPEGLPTIVPSLFTVNAIALIQFLKRAFNAWEENIVRSPSGTRRLGRVWIGDGAIELFESNDPWPMDFYLYVPDVDSLYQKAVAGGAKPLHPPADQPHGDRMGAVEDAWRNNWFIASHLHS